MSGQVAFSPGDWSVITAEGAALLLAVPPADPRAVACWDVVHGGGGADEIVDTLLADGWRSLPDLALVCWGAAARGAGALVMLRGAAAATLTAADGATRDLSASTARTWLEQAVDAVPTTVVLHHGRTDGPWLPLVEGVVPASAVRVEPAAVSAGRDGSAPEPPAAEPPADEVPADEVPGDDVPSIPERVVVEQPAAAPPAADPAPAPPAAEPVAAAEPPPAVVDPTQQVPAAAGPSAAPGLPHEPLPPDPLPTTPPPVPDNAAPVEHSGPFGPPQHSAAGGNPGGLIESVPWAGDAAGAPAGPPHVEPPVDPDAPTLDRASVAGLLDQPADAFTPGPTVHAAVCPYGHLTPPYDPYCRICGSPVPPQDPIVTARPMLGILRLSTGDVVPLDRGVLLGRSPRVDNEADPNRPHVVRLPSPANDISRSHVEVRLDDWMALVIDLGSTNGTTVTIPGQPPIRLRPHDPLPMEPNTEVNLADEVVFRFEVVE